MREIFVRQEGSEKVFIEIDLNAYAFSKKFSWLFSLFVKFDSIDESQEGYEEFLETKESLIITLEHNEKAKYVGSRVVDGWSEFYFYAQDSKGLNSIVSKILQESNYVFESNVVRDSKWDFHHKNLAPTELEECHIQSEKIIFMLEEEGDDLECIRPVEHYISFTTPTQKERFLQNLLLEGFHFKDDISSDDFEHGVALTKEHKVTSMELKKVIDELFLEVKKEQGFYEGWSTVLANEVEKS
ncbi:DUF695 domain-containing protein [Sulfurimonas sp.]